MDDGGQEAFRRAANDIATAEERRRDMLQGALCARCVGLGKKEPATATTTVADFAGKIQNVCGDCSEAQGRALAFAWEARKNEYRKRCDSVELAAYDAWRAKHPTCPAHDTDCPGGAPLVGCPACEWLQGGPL